MDEIKFNKLVDGFAEKAFSIIDYLSANDGFCGIVNGKTIILVNKRPFEAGCDSTWRILIADGVIDSNGVFQKRYDKCSLRKSITDMSEGCSSEIQEILDQFQGLETP